LTELAKEYAEATGQGALLPVIEKEIVHFEVMDALDECGVLDLLAFQGGTCLRLCYGAERFSEDLDFSAGDSYWEIDPEEVREQLERRVSKRYSLPVCVSNPQASRFQSGHEMRKWQIVIDTAPARPDIPSQRVKIEIASIPHHTTSYRMINSPVMRRLGGYEGLIIPTESLDEIAADKLISFADPSGYIRYRDIWDLSWLFGSDAVSASRIRELVLLKFDDYKVEFASLGALVEAGVSRATHARDREFEHQMARFIDPQAYARLFRTGKGAAYFEQRIKEIYELL